MSSVFELRAERDALAAKLATAAKDIRNLAELYLYDEATDQPINDGYGALICYADSLLADPEGEQPNADR